MTSPDGITWTQRATPEDNAWRSVCWSPELTLFCAIAGDGTNRVMTSPDGITWTVRSASSVSEWTWVCWSPELELFCAVAWANTNRVMTSPDGTTWTSQTAAEQNQWRSVVWSPELGLFCAVADSGTNRAMTSLDGITWTARLIAEDGTWYSVTWSPELGVFCAVAVADVNRIVTSPDGISWTSVAIPESNTWASVCWSPKLGIFCAVATTGTNKIMTSQQELDNYPTLCWFFEQRLFFAATPDEPNKIWGSQSGWYENLYVGRGLDSDAIIVSIKDAKKLLWVTTSGIIILGAHNAVYKLSANNINEALTPTNIRAPKITSYGSAFLPAVELDGSSIFIQRGLRKIRRFEYELDKDSYKAIDISILSEHITESGIIDIAYSDEPSSFIWAARTDGQLVCLTYEPEFGVFGWSRQVLGGADAKVKSVAVSDAITADKDELWAIISRTIDGSTVQYVEFLTQGLSPEDALVDATFMDSLVTKESPELVMNGGFDSDTANWIGRSGAVLASVAGGKSGNCLEITCDGIADPYAYQDINVVAGNVYTLKCFVKVGTEATYRAIIVDATNDPSFVEIWDSEDLEETAGDWSTAITKKFTAPGGCTLIRIELYQIALAGAGTTLLYDSVSLKKQFTTFTGLTHLIGETVQVFADGLVQATKVVSGAGEITIPASNKAHVGLAYDSVIETLPLEGGNSVGTAMGKIKRISNVVLRLYKSLKFKLSDLDESDIDTIDLGITLFTDDTEELDFYGDHETGGQMRITIDDPVPFTLLAIMYKARTGE